MRWMCERPCRVSKSGNPLDGYVVPVRFFVAAKDKKVAIELADAESERAFECLTLGSGAKGEWVGESRVLYKV